LPRGESGATRLQAIPSERNPFPPYSSNRRVIRSRTEAMSTTAPSGVSADEQTASTPGTVPLVTIRPAPSWETRMLNRFREKS